MYSKWEWISFLEDDFNRVKHFHCDKSQQNCPFYRQKRWRGTVGNQETRICCIRCSYLKNNLFLSFFHSSFTLGNWFIQRKEQHSKYLWLCNYDHVFLFTHTGVVYSCQNGLIHQVEFLDHSCCTISCPQEDKKSHETNPEYHQMNQIIFWYFYFNFSSNFVDINS